MATKYDIQTVTDTHNRLAGSALTEAEMTVELERPDFLPDIDRMIAVSDDLEDLDASDRYGLFQGMESDRYQISSGRWKFARYLTPDELSKCF